MSDHEAPVWHREVIPASTEASLRTLVDAHLLERFYVAGGTGLALQFGHRLSLDLDFFAPTEFDEDALLQRIQAVQGFGLVAKAPSTLHSTVNTTKISFLGYASPVLYPVSEFTGVSVADPRDIACMMVSAIASRGTKRDFVDLYVCAQKYGLDEILRMFNQKYAQANFSWIHLLKSLTFFADAEKDPVPHMLMPLEWRRVKEFFLTRVPQLF